MGLKKPLSSPNGAMRRGWNGITISRDTIHIDGVKLGFERPVFFEVRGLGADLPYLPFPSLSYLPCYVPTCVRARVASCGGRGVRRGLEVRGQGPAGHHLLPGRRQLAHLLRRQGAGEGEGDTLT